MAAMDRLDAIATFVRVADLRGFAPAARALGRSPSVITRQVAALEDRLGARLLQRTTRAVALTDAGARFLVRARQILADVADAEASAQADRAAPAGRLVVTAPTVFGRLHVAPVMSTYLARHVDVTAELTLSDRNVHLVDDEIDLAVRIGALADSSLVARPIGATRKVVVASPAYLAARGTPRRLDELARHATIHLNSVTAAPEWRFATDRVPLTPRYTTTSADVAIAHARAGGGLAMVFAYQAADALRAGDLRIVLARHEPPPAPIQLVFPSSRLLSAKVRAFIELVAEIADWRFVDL